MKLELIGGRCAGWSRRFWDTPLFFLLLILRLFTLLCFRSNPSPAPRPPLPAAPQHGRCVSFWTRFLMLLILHPSLVLYTYTYISSAQIPPLSCLFLPVCLCVCYSIVSYPSLTCHLLFSFVPSSHLMRPSVPPLNLSYHRQ